jgi:hypothetical protein
MDSATTLAFNSRVDIPFEYSFSFMGASLRPELARIIAEIYLESSDWRATKERVLSTNALQVRAASSARRLEGELRKRLATLTHQQIVLLAQATSEDRSAIAWLSALKHAQFVFDFASELLREKLELKDQFLRQSDYESFVETKSITHPELGRLANTSKYKIKQILLRMLAEADLLRKGDGLGTIHRPVLSPSVVRVIKSDSPHWFAGFLVPDSEIGGL